MTALLSSDKEKVGGILVKFEKKNEQKDKELAALAKGETVGGAEAGKYTSPT